MKGKKLSNQTANGVLRLTWPIFIELILQMLVGNADQIMVGWYNSDLVGAIGNANQITNLLIIIFSVICTAATILIAQHIGAKSTEQLGQTYTVSLLVNTLFGLGVMVILLTCCEPIYSAMQVPDAIFDSTCNYTRILSVGMALQAVYLTFTAFFRSHKMMKQTMVISVLVNCLNILGNAILINGFFGLPALGVEGAAISSVVSRILGVVAIAWLFRKQFGPVLSWQHLRPFPSIQLHMLLKIGIPSGGESVSYNLSQIMIQSLCNQLALFVVTTRVYANMFAMLSYTFASAIAQATQVLVAQLMGAGDTGAVNRRVMSTLKSAVTISGLVSTALFLGAKPVYSIFTQNTQVLELCSYIMLIEIPLELGRSVNIVMCRTLQACGDIRFPITICIISAWITAVGGGFIFGIVFHWGLPGIWLAMACDECLRAILFLFRWKSGKWKTKHMLSWENQ